MKTADWAPLAGAVVSSLGTSGMPRNLAGFLRQAVPFSYMVAFGYSGTARPVDLYDDFPEATRRIFVTDYQAGPYLLDPFYMAAIRPFEPGLYRLRDLAPDRFYQGEYYRNYYAQTGLAEEIAYFVDLPDRSTLVLSLMRAEKNFSHREFQTLQAVFPFVASAVRHHWKGLHLLLGKDGDVVGSKRPRHDLSDHLSSFGAGVLTPRECEIAAFTLKGHSAESAGQNLGISPGTVRIHRRNIYAKLRINSQGELFSSFLKTLVEAS